VGWEEVRLASRGCGRKNKKKKKKKKPKGFPRRLTESVSLHSYQGREEDSVNRSDGGKKHEYVLDIGVNSEGFMAVVSLA